MGGLVSYFWGPPDGDPDPDTGVTPKEAYLVAQTWDQIKKDLGKAGVELFMILFREHPHYKDYFPFKNIPYVDLRNSKKFKAHATNVIYTLSAVVDNVSNPDIFVQLLQRTGESHAGRNVPPEAMWHVKEITQEVLETSLGAKLSGATSEAWEKLLVAAFKIIENSMKGRRDSDD